MLPTMVHSRAFRITTQKPDRQGSLGHTGQLCVCLSHVNVQQYTAALIHKSINSLANRDIVSEWSDVSTNGMLLQ